MDTTQTSLDPLPTTPIGKQQIIDIHAGTILRKEESRKNGKFFGCSPAALLAMVIVLKCLVLSGWIYKEYHSFDYGCPFVQLGNFDYEDDENSQREMDYLPVRAKRSTEEEEFDSIPLRRKERKEKKKNRPVWGGSPALTTMVTMTNLQELPSANSSGKIKMKTIRQRMEKVKKNEREMMEREMERDEPTIYIAPIQSRFDPMIEDNMLSTVATTKEKKRKGKGRKRKEETTTTTTTEAPTTTKKKRKGLGRKKERKMSSNRIPTEQTKSPRHLMAPVGQTTATTERPTGRKSFIEGGIEPIDRKKANKGHIRGFSMKKATKKPKSSIKLSEETRMMWEMNELNYTTHAMQVKTTEMTKAEEDISSFINSLPNEPRPKEDEEQTTQTTTSVKDFYSSRMTSWSKKNDQVTRPPKGPTTIPPVVVELRTENAIPKEGAQDILTPTVRSQPVAIYYETVIEPPRKPMESTLAQLGKAAEQTGEDLFGRHSDSNQKVKHGFDRSLDEAIEAGTADASNRPTPSPKQRDIEDEDQRDRFQNELKSFTSNALCMVRTFFDSWCGCQILTSFPYLLGICFAKRNLFVTHLLCDIFFLGAGFLCSITLLALSIILYVSVDEMTTTEFLHWLIFVFVIEILLIGYTFVVYFCYQCSERLIIAKRHGQSKDSAAEAV